MSSLTCSECLKQLDGTDALSKHFRDVHDPLPSYLCGQSACKKRFLDKNSLIRHISSFHRVNVAGPSCQGVEPLPIGLPHNVIGNDSLQNQAVDEVADVESNRGMHEENLGASSRNVQEVVNNSAVHLLLNMRSTASLTGKAVERFEVGCTQMLNDYIVAVKEKLSACLLDKGVDPTEVSDVLKNIEIDDPFKNLKSIDDQLEYFSNEFGMAKPESKYLDTRIDQRLDPSTNSYLPTQVVESFQYVSITETLKAILKKESNRNKIFKDHSSKDGIIRSYADSLHCKNHPFINEHENVVQILLFYDELEVANSLGSKTIIHKLGAFFYQIINLPPEESSELSSIHLLSLVNADDMKKPGAFKKVLSPFVEDMKKLSSDDGVKMQVEGGEEFVVRAVLVALTADTPAAHDVLGFLAPGARHFCRWCKVSRVEVRENANAVGEMRTVEDHHEDVQRVARQARYSTECGVKCDSPLNDIPYFHCVTNSVFDCFHDLCEGVIPLVLKLVLYEYIVRRKYMSVTELNSRVASFSYGYPDSKNKPSPNFTIEMLSSKRAKLKQTGSQMWCLMRAIAFILGEKVPLGDEHMELIFTLQDFMNIVFSYQIRQEDLDRLETLIQRHNELFESLFVRVALDDEEEEEDDIDEDGEEDGDEEAIDDPDEVVEGEFDEEEGSTLEEQPQANQSRKKTKKPPRLKVYIINKLHHLKHYAEMIRQFGNPVRYWCAKFEGRLKIFRQHAAVCCNFKNTPKTMARMFQLSNLKSLIGEKTDEVDHLKGECVQLSRHTEHSDLLLAAGLKEGDQLLYTNGATLNGEEYRPSLFVNLESTRRGPQFAIICKVIVSSKKVFLLVKRWQNNGICPRYNAYKAIPAHPNQRDLFAVRTVGALASFRCIAPWTTQNNDVYLSSRTVLM